MSGKFGHFGKSNSFKVKVFHQNPHQQKPKHGHDQSKSMDASRNQDSADKKRPIDELLNNQADQNKRRKIDFVAPVNPKNGFGTLSPPVANHSHNYKGAPNAASIPSERTLVTTDKAVRAVSPIGLFDPAIVNTYLAWNQVKRVGPGFYNEGNSCYLNSTLQCLLYIPALVQVLLKETDAALKNIPRHQQNQMKAISEIFANLVNDIWSDQAGPQKAILPRGMVSTIRRVGKQFKPFRQEDAHEYLRQLLDTMHEEVLKANRLKTSDGKPAETTFISRIFGGYLCNTLTCSQCGYASKTYNHFLDLSLEIRQGIQSLQDAIMHFIKPEQLSQGNEWNCDGCKRKVKATKQMTISEAPPVLAIQLKRFAMSFGMSFMSNNKITKSIQFPLQLSLPCTKQKQPVSYDLTGVVVHHGSTTHSGHYIAYVKAPNGIWYEMNDSSVSQVSVNRVQQAQAYLLFYSQKPKAVPQSTPTSSIPPSVPTTSPSGTIPVAHGASTLVKEEKKTIDAKPAVVRFDPLTLPENEDKPAKLKVPLTPAPKKDSNNFNADDEEEEDSEMDSEIEDDMMDDDDDYDDENEDFPPLYCTHIFRYKSPLERFRRWYWTTRPNLYKERHALRKFTKYPSMRNTKMVLRKYLLVRQHIAGIFQQDSVESEDDEKDVESEVDSNDPDRDLFIRSKVSVATNEKKEFSLMSKQQMITEDDDSDSDDHDGNFSESEEVDDNDEDASSEQDEITEQDDDRNSRKHTMKQATMDDILDMSRRARTLGGEGVWEGVVSDKAKQKIEEISKQQRREDQIHRKQYRLSEWDQSLDAGHIRKVKEPKAPLQDNTGKNNPFQHVTEQRRQDKQSSLEAGEYEDFRGEVQKHQRPRPPQYKDNNKFTHKNNHNNKSHFNNKKGDHHDRRPKSTFNKQKSFGKN